MLPRSLRIESCYKTTGVAQFRGGFADVWKGEYRDQEVAVKQLRIYANSDLQKITRVGRDFPGIATVLTVTHAEVLQGVLGVESPSPSECAAVAGGHNDRDPVRDGVGVDDEREHQQVCGCTSGCEPAQTCTFRFWSPPSSLVVDVP